MTSVPNERVIAPNTEGAATESVFSDLRHTPPEAGEPAAETMNATSEPADQSVPDEAEEAPSQPADGATHPASKPTSTDRPASRISCYSNDSLTLVKDIKVELVDDSYNAGATGYAARLSPLSSPAMTPPREKLVSVGRQRYYAIGRISYVPDTCVCEVCQTELSGPKVLNMHKLCHFNTSHVCYVCDCYLQNANAMIVHMATQHANLNTVSHLMADGQETLVCPICLQKFATKSTLQKHQANHLTVDSSHFSCRMCGLNFMGIRALVAHLSSSRHTEMKVKLQGIFVCIDCRSIFATRDSYAMHMMERAQNETCKEVRHDYKLPPADGKREGRATTPGNQHENIKGSSHLALGSPMPGLVTADAVVSSSPLNLSRGNTALSSQPSTPQPMMPPPSPHNTCSKCLSSFSTQDALALHMMMHARSDSMPEVGHGHSAAGNRPSSAPVLGSQAPIPWMCGQCLLPFDTCDALAMHMMTKHSDEAISDPVMLASMAEKAGKEGEIFSENIQDLLKNATPVNDISELSENHGAIILAGTSYEEKEKANGDHEGKEDAGPEPKRRKCYIPKRKGWECTECGKSFANKLEWSYHLQKCSTIKRVSSYCDICETAFLDVKLLSNHLHSQMHQQRLAEQRVCTVCGFVGNDRQHLINHLRIQHRADPRAGEPETGDWAQRAEKHPEPDVVIVTSEQELAGKEPLNLMTNHQTTVAKDRLEKDCPEEQEVGQIPESSTGQDSWAKDHAHGGTPLSGTVSQSGIAASEDDSESDIVDFVLSHVHDLSMCKHCRIVYTDRTMYYLHMGLHNLNNPWQCNMCGKVCRDLHEFSSHVIHYQ